MNDQNPELVFRAREKERYKLRKKKGNDVDQYHKLLQNRKDLELIKFIAHMIKRREKIKLYSLRVWATKLVFEMDMKSPEEKLDLSDQEKKSRLYKDKHLIKKSGTNIYNIVDSGNEEAIEAVTRTVKEMLYFSDTCKQLLATSDGNPGDNYSTDQSKAGLSRRLKNGTEHGASTLKVDLNLVNGKDRRKSLHLSKKDKLRSNEAIADNFLKCLKVYSPKHKGQRTNKQSLKRGHQIAGQDELPGKPWKRSRVTKSRRNSLASRGSAQTEVEGAESAFRQAPSRYAEVPAPAVVNPFHRMAPPPMFLMNLEAEQDQRFDFLQPGHSIDGVRSVDRRNVSFVDEEEPVFGSLGMKVPSLKVDTEAEMMHLTEDARCRRQQVYFSDRQRQFLEKQRARAVVQKLRSTVPLSLLSVRTTSTQFKPQAPASMPMSGVSFPSEQLVYDSTFMNAESGLTTFRRPKPSLQVSKPRSWSLSMRLDEGAKSKIRRIYQEPDSGEDEVVIDDVNYGKLLKCDVLEVFQLHQRKTRGKKPSERFVNVELRV